MDLEEGGLGGPSAAAMPATVRYGLGLLAIALVVRVVTMAGTGRSLFMTLAALLMTGSLLIAAARRRNWARIALVLLVAIGIAFNTMSLPIELDQDRLAATSSVVQSVLQACGVILLLRQGSVRWYSAPQH